MRWLGKLGWVLAALTLVGAEAVADTPQVSYRYLDGGYQKMTGDLGPDGFFLRGSYGFHERFYVAGGVDQLEKSGVKQQVMSLGGGMVMPVDSRTDVYGELRLVRAKITVKMPWIGSVSDSDSGFQVEAGGRMMLSPQWEARAFLRYMDVGEADETFIGGQGVYRLQEQFALHAGASRLMDASEFLFELGGRFNF